MRGEDSTACSIGMHDYSSEAGWLALMKCIVTCVQGEVAGLGELSGEEIL